VCPIIGPSIGICIPALIKMKFEKLNMKSRFNRACLAHILLVVLYRTGQTIRPEKGGNDRADSCPNRVRPYH
jgi:hypothetical protein